MPTVSVTYKGETTKYEVETGSTLFEVLQNQGFEMPHGCLAGVCASCKFEVKNNSQNLENPSAVEKDTISHISEKFPGKDMRLGCRAKVIGDLEIEIPEKK